jgi:glycosyltransferase involved in cell wall biosynthesis
MNLLMLSYEYPPIGGGGGKVVQGLAREFVRRGHQIDIVTMKFDAPVKKESFSEVNLYRVPCIRKSESVCHTHEMASYIAFAMARVQRLVKEKRYELNHTHFILPDGIISYFLKKKTGLPYVITSHGSDVPGYNPERFRVQHKIFAPVWKAVVRNADLIVCPSETQRSLLLRKKPDTHSCVIPNGIDPRSFDPNYKKQRRILVVTRMLQRKGVQYVIKALRGFDSGYEVNIVGDGPYLVTLRDIATREGVNVKFRGWLENGSKEMKELFETSRIFIFPSEAENFPIVLLEAMAAGLAIITTKGTGCAEVVGDCALLVSPRNEKEIRNAINILTTDESLCKELGKSCRRRLEDKFSWEAVAGKYLDIFQKYQIQNSLTG